MARVDQSIPWAPSHHSFPRAHSHRSNPWALSHMRMMRNPEKPKGKPDDEWSWKKKLDDADIFVVYRQGNDDVCQVVSCCIAAQYARFLQCSIPPLIMSIENGIQLGKEYGSMFRPYHKLSGKKTNDRSFKDTNEAAYFLQTFGVPIDKSSADLAIRSGIPITKADDFAEFERIGVNFFKCCNFGEEESVKAIRGQPAVVILRLSGTKFENHKKMSGMQSEEGQSPMLLSGCASNIAHRGIYSNPTSGSVEIRLHAVVALGFKWTSKRRLAILIQENDTRDWGDDGCSYVDFEILWRKYFIVPSFLAGGVPKGYRAVDV